MKQYFTILPGGKNHTTISDADAHTILENATKTYARPYKYSAEEAFLYESETDNVDNDDNYSITIAVKINGEWHKAI